ncbi:MULTISPECIES: UbiA family prenyltransferase [unclassified Isoptericola]|uniref:UbiA family prenyltransferase n=1 Tax=unclassified Isoptericola TaxID=2623355 RepID=UPI0027137B99|nr:MULTISPECIES: UbiA family prenyltransferase [unclassified Isoptericola]MDO8145898.1 UbiA family prenyltransferase [Isoptericola sp. 178]MDO8147749.1 UbiA family prenyltransferase [Isoptericola sp. b515]
MARRGGAAARSRVRTAALVLREARPKVLAIGALRYLTGALLSGGLVLSPRTLTGLVAWILMTVAVYVLNGVTDVRADQLNGSRRPVASGRLSVRTARASLWACGLLAVGLSLVVSWVFAVHLVFALALGIGYSSGARPAKASSPAAFVVVVLGGLVTYHAGLVASGGHLTPAYLVFSTCMALWMGVGSMLKDLTDVEGDRAARRATLAVLRGPALTAGLAAGAAVLVTAVMVGAATGLSASGEFLHVPAVALVLGTATLCVTCAKVALRTAWPYRIFMYTQFAAHGTLVHL